ncbi:MAG: hypothetical protein OSA84_13650 [Akkermansiaceae bacterium]|nr:hypothetical protein [Akkermansiaceae bacterium]
MSLISSSSIRSACIAALLSLPFIALSGAAVETAPRPIRVLFLGHESEDHNSGKYLPYLMDRFGREAIYFDYYTTLNCLNSETLSLYDTVMLYANHENISQAQMVSQSDRPYVEK